MLGDATGNTMLKWIKDKNRARHERRRQRAVAKLRKLLAEISPRINDIDQALAENEARTNAVIKELNRKMVSFGQPMLIDLHRMVPGSKEEIETSSLGQSLTALKYIGAGAMIYYDDPNLISIGKGTELRDFSILEVGGTLRIGENCVVGAYNWFQSSGKITLGNGVILGPQCCVISTSHVPPEDGSEVRSTELIKDEVTIGDNCWIGANVQILKGVTIGRNVIIGAGSVVTKDIPDNSKAVGSPCRVIPSA